MNKLLKGGLVMCFTLVESRAELIPIMPPGEVFLDEAPNARSAGK